MLHDDRGMSAAKWWLQYAQADLAFARVPLPPLGRYEQLCFHAQQAAEKSLKAVLVKVAIDFPYTHNLQRLLDLLPGERAFTKHLLEAGRLTAYAVLCRYPCEEEPVPEDEYREALRISEAVFDWARCVIEGTTPDVARPVLPESDASVDNGDQKGQERK